MEDFNGDLWLYHREGLDGPVHSRRLVELALRYGWGADLWRGYLAWLLAMDENPFSLACEGRGTPGGTLEKLARLDLTAFSRAAALDAVPELRDFEGGPAPDPDLAAVASALESPEALLALVTGFYRRRGVGLLGLHRAFRLAGEASPELEPIVNVERVSLSDIVGYEIQKGELAANTEAFLAGRPANNVLLYGDSGTGKSTCVKALLNDYRDSALRVIELQKHQFRQLPALIAKIKGRNYRFILFIDDLSFEEHEVEYKFLKAAIEGGLETHPGNILIYATSNRRHIVREMWRDRDDMEHNGDVHRSDTLEEKLSLASRFGVAINFSTPARKHYHEIVEALARRAGVPVTEKLLKDADRWELRHGGVSGRTARQFIDWLSGQSVI